MLLVETQLQQERPKLKRKKTVTWADGEVPFGDEEGEEEGSDLDVNLDDLGNPISEPEPQQQQQPDAQPINSLFIGLDDSALQNQGTHHYFVSLSWILQTHPTYLYPLLLLINPSVSLLCHPYKLCRGCSKNCTRVSHPHLPPPTPHPKHRPPNESVSTRALGSSRRATAHPR